MSLRGAQAALALLDEPADVAAVHGDGPAGAVPPRAPVTVHEADGDQGVPIEAPDRRLDLGRQPIGVLSQRDLFEVRVADHDPEQPR